MPLVDDSESKWPTARPFVPVSRDVESLRRAAAGCKGCDLYKHATQTVLGQGAVSASIVCLGATAAKALLGSSFRITQSRGKLLDAWGRSVIATWHPSAVLRTHDDPAQARRMFDELASDLRLAAARHIKGTPKTRVSRAKRAASDRGAT